MIGEIVEEVSLGENFLRDLVRAAAQDVAGFLAPGGATAAFLLERGAYICAKAAWDCLKRKKPPQQQRMLDAMALVDNQRSRAIAAAEIDRYRFNADTKGELINYLSVIPMTSRRAITHPNDGGKPATMLSQLPRSETDLLRFVPTRPPLFQPGDQVQGHDYRVETLLGQGGFGEVWKAHHTVQATQPAVALKFCPDRALLVSLKTEIKIYEILQGDEAPADVVRLISTAYSAQPAFIVYEYVDGADLAAWLAAFDGKAPPVKNIVQVLRMSARALARAHRLGIVHRDLKPGNLLVSREGRIKIADFGIGAILANARAQDAAGNGLTNATLLQSAYTPICADPRQRLGGLAETSMDVYALGILAFQLLIGDFRREMGPAWRAELEERNIPAALLDIVGTCVDVPAKRFSDAGSLLAALDQSNLIESSKKPVHQSGSEAIHNHCIQCGAHVQHGDSFCTQCGRQIR